jgi:hypothetical protein
VEQKACMEVGLARGVDGRQPELAVGMDCLRCRAVCYGPTWSPEACGCSSGVPGGGCKPCVAQNTAAGPHSYPHASCMSRGAGK